VYLPSSSPSGPRSSGGGGTSTIIVTNPSAGETINLSPRGVVRTGSRKKAATQIVRPSRSHAITPQCRRKASNVIAPAPTANLRPSGWTDGNRHLTVVVIGLSGFSRAGIGAP